MDRVVTANEGAGRMRGGAGLFDRTANGVVLIADVGGSQGTGVVISKSEGLIITNWHVIQNARRLGVFFKPPGGLTVEPAAMFLPEIVRVNQRADLAILRVSGIPDHVVELPLGDLDAVRVGADVHAIGHPTGELWTYTRGFVSQVRPGYEWRTQSNVPHRATVIQTQTPINPGNSGGPLMDDEGRVVGINTFVRSQAQGINYAVSVTDVRALLAVRDEAPRPGPGGKGGGASTPDAGPGKGSGCVRVQAGFVGVPATREGRPIDSNCNGRMDMIAYDTNGDGRANYILADTTGDGRHDVRVEDRDGDGYLEYWRIDRNGDGTADVEGWDNNRSGRPGKLVRIS